MQKINAQLNLRKAILLLEETQTKQGQLLKAEIYLAYESIQPINIFKNTLKEITASPTLKEGLLSASIGWATDFLSERFFEDRTLTPIKKIFGTALIFGITNVIERNSDTFKSIGINLLSIIKYKLLRNTSVPKNDKTESDID